MRIFVLASVYAFICTLLFPSRVDAESLKQNAYDFEFRTLTGENLKLVDYKGKVILVVNVASQCGFTPQYAGLQKLYDKYKDKGLVIIGVPSNQFGNQEPATSSEIKQFTKTEYNITFPIVEKTEVKGSNAHPFFKWLSNKLGIGATPRWNFYKYIIGRDGQPKEWFSSMTEPESQRIISRIEGELAKGEMMSIKALN